MKFIITLASKCISKWLVIYNSIINDIIHQYHLLALQDWSEKHLRIKILHLIWKLNCNKFSCFVKWKHVIMDGRKMFPFNTKRFRRFSLHIYPNSGERSNNKDLFIVKIIKTGSKIIIEYIGNLKLVFKKIITLNIIWSD